MIEVSLAEHLMLDLAEGIILASIIIIKIAGQFRE